MVSALVIGLEQRIFFAYHVIFQLAHAPELVTGLFLHHLAGTAHHVSRVAFKRIPVLVVIRAKQVQSGDFGKRVQVSGAVTRDHVQVARAGIQVLEQARPVHPFAAAEDGLHIIQIVDYEVEGLQAAVSRHVAEVDHLDLVFLDVTEDVFFREFRSRLLKKLHQRVRVH